MWKKHSPASGTRLGDYAPAPQGARREHKGSEHTPEETKERGLHRAACSETPETEPAKGPGWALPHGLPRAVTGLLTRSICTGLSSVSLLFSGCFVPLFKQTGLCSHPLGLAVNRRRERWLCQQGHEEDAGPCPSIADWGQSGTEEALCS